MFDTSFERSHAPNTKPQSTTEPIKAPERVKLWICCHCQAPRMAGLTVCERCGKKLHDVVEYIRSPASTAPVVDNLLSRLINELEQAVTQGYQPNLLDVAEAKRLLTTKPLAAMNEAARSAAGEILDFLNFDCENDEVKQDISSAAYIISKFFPSAAAATAAPVEQSDESEYVVIDGERRRVVPCPDGRQGCEVLHTEPITNEEAR